MEVRYHKVCYCNYTKFLTREAKGQSESERSVSVYGKSYDVFCNKVIERQSIAKVIENVDVESYSRRAKRFSIAAIVTGSSNN